MDYNQFERMQEHAGTENLRQAFNYLAHIASKGSDARKNKGMTDEELREALQSTHVHALEAMQHLWGRFVWLCSPSTGGDADV